MSMAALAPLSLIKKSREAPMPPWITNLPGIVMIKRSITGAVAGVALNFR